MKSCIAGEAEKEDVVGEKKEELWIVPGQGRTKVALGQRREEMSAHPAQIMRASALLWLRLKNSYVYASEGG